MKKLVLVACASAAAAILLVPNLGFSKDTGPSKFEGIWGSLEVKEYRSNKTKEFVCSNTQNEEWTDHQNEFNADLMMITKDGKVLDLSTSGDVSAEAIWNVHNDGSVSDSYILTSGSDESMEILSQSMTKVDENTVENVFKLKSKPSGEVFESRIEFVRTSKKELAEIDAIVKTCKIK